jgi:hypothetical protein
MKLAEAKQVVFAHDEVTVHTLLSPDPVKDAFGEEVYNTESKVLLPGQFVPEEDVPPYLLKKIEDGTALGVSLMSESEADELAEKAAQIRAIASGEQVNFQGVPSESESNKESLRLAAEAVSSKKRKKSE